MPLENQQPALSRSRSLRFADFPIPMSSPKLLLIKPSKLVRGFAVVRWN